MNKSNVSKVVLWALFLCLFGVSVVHAASDKRGVVVGADLEEYKKPSKKECDIKVPAQYQTIQAGIDAAVAGDTVCVGPGTYNETVWIRKPLRLSGSGSGSTVITGAYDEQTQTTMMIYYANDVIVEGFKIVGQEALGAPAILVSNPDNGIYNLNLQYNHVVSGDGSAAIRVDGVANSFLIQNNIIEVANSVNQPQLVLVQISQGTIVDILNNTFIGTTGESAYVVGNYAKNSSINRNVFGTTGTPSVLIGYGYGTGIGSDGSEVGGVNYNNFNSISVKKVEVIFGHLNAENNWWGDLDPSDNIQGDIDYTPFATEPFREAGVHGGRD